MRALEVFCAVVLLVAVAQALPADSRLATDPKLARLELEKDAEEIPVPQNPPAFDGFLDGIGEMFERMRQQMLYLMSHVPRFGFTTPEGGNTTSVTKVIDGHKVTINETVYTSGDGEDAAAVFKVRVVDIRPDSAESDVGDASMEPAGVNGPKGSVESLENEIPKSLKKVHQQKRKVNSMDHLEKDLDNYNNLETFDDNDLETFDETDKNDLELLKELETFDESAENSIENDIGLTRRQYPGDLSRDTRVNDYASQYGKKQNPDAEILPGFEPPRDLSRDTRINYMNHTRTPNPDAEVFDPSRPSMPYSRHANVFDLSRDTYVNEITNRDIHPDAEFILPSPRSRYYYRTDN